MTVYSLLCFVALGFASTAIESRMWRVFAIALIASLIQFLAAYDCKAAEPPDPLTEIRYCGPPVRLADGSIRRRADVLAAFRRAHPCPPTLRTTGACPGWSMNHIVPLACGGCDAVWNLQWLPNDLKSASGTHMIDRFERKIYGASIPDTAACTLEIVP